MLVPRHTDRLLNEHPWGPVALRDADGQRRSARMLLQNWIVEGLTPDRIGPDTACGWFDADYYLKTYTDLQPILSASNSTLCLRHYLLHGWREGRRPHLLFDPGHYLHQLQQRGAVLTASESPLEHWLRKGITNGFSPTPLLHRTWFDQHTAAVLLHDQAPDLIDLHPWAAAALQLNHGDLQSAADQLGHWIEAGTPALDAISKATNPEEHGFTWVDEPVKTHAINGLDAMPGTWQQIGWLASLGSEIDHNTQSDEPGRRAHICWAHPNIGTLQSFLQELPTQATVIAAGDPNFCKLLRRFRVASTQLDPPSQDQLNAWLPADPWLSMAEAWFGLPAPQQLSQHGVVCLGDGGPFWNQQKKLTLPYFPGFDDLVVQGHEHARAIGAWLWHCHLEGITLVHFQTQRNELDDFIWLPVVRINPYGLDQAGLLYELAALENPERDEAKAAKALPTPHPTQTISLAFGEQSSDHVAILVSLYNYANHIKTALNSIVYQTLEPLQLIVVDDASTDEGQHVVSRWMEEHHTRFSYCALISHIANGGLAAARNSAFAHTQASWCFVLDADNSLDPEVIEQCLNLTKNASLQLGVVHPLIRRIDTDGVMDDLVSRKSWQQEALASGNYIDAMALVRKKAWQQVGGYTHIPGGWEDYDFWCKLIEGGFHGVLCPHILANYQIHSGSMVHQSSHRNTRRLSRLLQHRHPWLQLPLGKITM